MLSNTNIMHGDSPKALLFTSNDSMFSEDIKLMIHGQGVFIFENRENQFPCVFTFYDANQADGIRVEFTAKNVRVNTIFNCLPLKDPANTKGLTNLTGAYYWFSIDSQNQKLYAGIGEARLDNIIYKYEFPNTNKDVWKANKQFLEGLTHIYISKESLSIHPMKLLRDPITNKIPLVVKNTHELMMCDIARSKYLPKSNLSMTSQVLYDCIAGEKFVLDDAEFPDFTKAIEYSIATPGCWCNTRLQEKSTEFNKDKPNILETYLRITLGENNGESPGIPYVMEIWPVGHYSPIHSHASADAIIRVLHGDIFVELYPFLCSDKDGVEPFANKTFYKDEITWISPTLNQVHKLTNLEKNEHTCITIQCYMYNDKNRTHYDYFDYLDVNGKVQQYEPDSDMDFVKFKELMKTEWTNRPRSFMDNVRHAFCPCCL
jgi:hypothetical protein